MGLVCKKIQYKFIRKDKTVKSNRIKFGFLLFFALTLLSSCSNAASTIIEMELTQDYDSEDPFINEKLIYVSDNVDNLSLDVSFQMEGESGILEIADNETKQVLWSNTWDGTVESTTFTISLDNLEKEKEYVVRFTGTGIKDAKIVITSENSLVKEQARPKKSSKD